MKHAPVPLAPTKLSKARREWQGEQPDEARKTAQLGQRDPQSKQIADLT